MRKEKYRLQYHLMPPTGWMNDPNGFCYYEGAYHIFFQYSPDDVYGGTKYWGHYRSKNLIDWEYLGIAIRSDCPWDKDGAYSGCGFTEDGEMELFYTGNVLEEGEHDFIHSGRGANVIRVTSKDGIHFSKKELLLTNQDYPKNYTCHIRDPKVWKKDNTYYMVLGGRKCDDTGSILQYQSKDKIHWEFAGEIATEEPFGYMWECPDTFSLDNKTVLMCCPQGVERERFHFWNVHQCGYFLLDDREKENLGGTCKREQFRELDFGYDFYAPQTMSDPKGRRLLFGWAGMSEMEPEFDNEPIIAEGWQHSLTLPRELTLCNGIVYQYPVEEINALRGDEVVLSDGANEVSESAFDCEIHFKLDAGKKECLLDKDVKILWEDGIFSITLSKESGRGRGKREILLPELQELRILKDVSMLEIYVNHGEYVYTARYYPENVLTTNVSITNSTDAGFFSMKK